MGLRFPQRCETGPNKSMNPERQTDGMDKGLIDLNCMSCLQFTAHPSCTQVSAVEPLASFGSCLEYLRLSCLQVSGSGVCGLYLICFKVPAPGFSQRACSQRGCHLTQVKNCHSTGPCQCRSSMNLPMSCNAHIFGNRDLKS